MLTACWCFRDTYLHPCAIKNMIFGKTLTVKLNNRSSNIVVFMLHKTCSYFTQLMRRIGNYSLHVPLFNYVRYNYSSGCYGYLRLGDGHCPLSTPKDLTISALPIRNATEVHETAAGCNKETNHTMRHSIFDFLLNVRKPVWNNSICTLEDEQFLKFLSIRSLCGTHWTASPFVFPTWMFLLRRF